MIPLLLRDFFTKLDFKYLFSYVIVSVGGKLFKDRVEDDGNRTLDFDLLNLPQMVHKKPKFVNEKQFRGDWR